MSIGQLLERTGRQSLLWINLLLNLWPVEPV
jgi:hypothetical protein